MFHRNPKSQNTTSVSKCALRKIAAACISVLGLHSWNAHAQVKGVQAVAEPAVAAPPVSAANPQPGAVSATTATAATTADAATRVMAREFATRGADAFDRGAFSEALDDFNRAAALLDAPTIAIMQARSLVKLGRWIEGLDRYQQTARYALNPSDPPPYHDAVRQAATEGEALRQQLPQLSLLVDPTMREQVAVELDGQLLPSLLLNTSRPVDPGTHKLKASKGSVPFLERSIETPPGQHVEIELTLPVTRAVVVPPIQNVPPPAPASPRPNVDVPEPNFWPLVGVATIAGLGAVGVGVTALLGSSAQAQLEDKCSPQDNCPTDQRSNLDTLRISRTLFYVSSAMFVIGGGLTAYLLLTDESSDGARAQLSLSPVGAQLTTMF